MKPFKLIKGSSNSLEQFEEEVSQAIEEGYELGGDLISKLVENQNGSEVLFFQPLTFEDALDTEDLVFEDEEKIY